ncbi:MAG: ATP-binding cassette domain-containing protein [Thermoflexales bacterium]|nr:ATP-binding cassette domain-containing protein [Thermoflexales bacterium]
MKVETSRLQADQVAFRYPQNNHGLAPVTLSVEPGEMLLVGGASGCGKSTLARCLTGLIPHLYRGTFSGEVWLDDLQTTRSPLWRIAERAGMVFQNPSAQMLTASVEEEIIFGLENMGLPSETIRQRLEAALARFDLEALRERSPHTLSGGEQQKLALAAVLARQPAVMALDEPFSMLDGAAAAELLAHLVDLAESGASVVICEHREDYLAGTPGLRIVHLGSDHSQERPSEPPVFDFELAPFELCASGLTVRLGERLVLNEQSFSAKGGELIAVVGRNGVGKTTLLRALVGLQAHGGTVTVDGEPPELGMVFQNADLQLFNASVRDEVLYHLPEPDLRFYGQVLEVLGLSRYEHTPPLLLSEGEKKRLALATVLMRRPRHGVLLDEPALGQDAAHKVALVRLARGLTGAGQLVIMTTHDLALAARADRLLLMGADGLVADGPPSQVMGDPGPWKRIGLPRPV